MKCRHCASTLTLPFLDLGSAPPSNAYLGEAALRAPEVWYPLRLLVCTCCWLVQTEDHAGREALFTQDYAYFSSFSSSWLEHARQYVRAACKRLQLNAASTVVEVAANDGYLLQYMQQAGIPCYGIEPTASTARAARAKGIEVIEQFFGVSLAHELAAQGRQADLIVANNVLAHVPDINDFVAGFAHLLKPHGVATFEFPHLLRMVQGCQFDTAYHEHYSYLSLTAVARICAANGLSVIDVQELPTHGGSLRVWAVRTDAAHYLQAAEESVARVRDVLASEQAAGMLQTDFYRDFQREALRIKRELLTFLLQCQATGQRVGAYGAAAKGNTLLNFAGVRPDLLPWVVDANPAKQGQYLPGSRIPIVDEEHLRRERPDYVLILPWNLKDEVARQLAYIGQWGGRLVVAVPNMEIFS
ncbi:methyltransferase C-terminal domain-containing protein [Melaminivora jejuensis]|uniref:class I SAM-dependent methyltransferase n=1 Tax=Melaminivora jejuensis TaxID=1267217 RepID=UPI001AE0CE65|nr:class I SAM-dependent methyltransferase [Melaminivora jejuensis]UHJ64629.1 class I SAM-dependent methyltransferase [Melaminivora jejuensis]